MERTENWNHPGMHTTSSVRGRGIRRPRCAFGGERENGAVKALILDYPRMRAELLTREEDIIFGRGDLPFCGGVRPWAARPTEAKTAYLEADEVVRGLRLKCAAVFHSLNLLRPEYRRVVCLRFWGVMEEEQAFLCACMGKPLFGLRFGSTRGLQSVEDLAGYSERQARRIVRMFLTMVSDELERRGALPGEPDSAF